MVRGTESAAANGVPDAAKRYEGARPAAKPAPRAPGEAARRIIGAFLSETPPAVTRAQIVDRIAAATGLTRLETEAVVEGFLHTVVAAVRDGGAVELRGFGTFEARPRAARTARNPRTGEPADVPRQFVPVFRPAAGFREAVNAARMAAEGGGDAEAAG